MKLTFSSNGSNYTATEHDIFMDNGANVVYIKGGKTANPTASRVPIKAAEWQRIKPMLNPIDYETYYGRKPLLKDVAIYQIRSTV